MHQLEVDDIEVVRAVKLGGVASGDRMEPSAVATNTQQATYAIPGKKTSGYGLLLPWLLWICDDDDDDDEEEEEYPYHPLSSLVSISDASGTKGSKDLQVLMETLSK